MSSITTFVSSTSTSATPLSIPTFILTSPETGPYDTCTPFTITWTYSGQNQLLFIGVFSSLSPNVSLVLNIVDPSVGSWTWPSINVPPAEYDMEAWLLSTGLGYSMAFTVVDGGDTSCVADIATSSPTSSATTDVGAIVGGIVGGVVGIILLVLLLLLYRRRRRTPNANASRATRDAAGFQLAHMSSQTARGRIIEAPYPVDVNNQGDFIPDYIPASGDEKGGYHGFGEPLPAYTLPPSSLHVPGSAFVNDHRK